MKQLILILTIFTIVFTFYSCSDNSVKTKLENTDLIPLSVGNIWVYLDSSFEDGKVSVQYTTSRVTRLATINLGFKEYRAFNLTEFNQKGEQAGQIFLSNEGDGLVNYGGDNDPFNLAYRDLLLKYPTSENDTWNTVYHYFVSLPHKFSHDTCAVRCLSTKETININNENLSAIKYQYELMDSIKVIEYWKPGTGMLSYSRYENDELVFKRILNSMTINE